MRSQLAGGPPLFLSSRRTNLTEDISRELTTRMFVRYDNGDLVIITPLEKGYQEIEDVFANGDAPLKYKAYRGLYIVWEYEPAPNGKPIPGTGMRVEFPVPPEDLPEPIPGAGWRGVITKVFDDKTRQTSRMEIGFSTAPGIKLDNSHYRVVQADLVFDRGTDRRMDVRYLYLPAFRTALFVSSRMGGTLPVRIAPIGLGEGQ